MVLGLFSCIPQNKITCFVLFAVFSSFVFHIDLPINDFTNRPKCLKEHQVKEQMTITS